MCLGIPMRVISVDGMSAVCAGRGDRITVDTLLTGPLAPGQWVMTFLGAAREIIDETTADQVNRALDALDQMLAGGEVDMETHFGDLIHREPQLPDFLRPVAAHDKEE